MSAYNLIIFDCDGTLVDSEILYNTITSEILTQSGYPEYTPEKCFADFAGHSWTTIRGMFLETHGKSIPEDIVERYIGEADRRMETELKATEHADALVRFVSSFADICVASNGERGNVIKSLTITNLMPHFGEDKVFTKTDVPRPKPAPDLFLHAAKNMNAAPDRCLVIEDSIAGVHAGLSAGMDVWGFTGAHLNPKRTEERMRENGVHKVFDTLIHIRRALEEQKSLL